MLPALIPADLITGTQIGLHGFGDYFLQSSWMSTNKIKNSWAAMAHALAYSAPFLLIGPSLNAWLFIAISHFFIDRFRLIRFINYANHFLSPPSYWMKWKDCNETGYPNDLPPYLKKFLVVTSDNFLHIFCNGFALYYL